MHFMSFIATINRAVNQKQLFTYVKNTTLVTRTLKKLMTLGFIRGFTILSNKKIQVFLKLSSDNNKQAIQTVKCISKPGKKIFMGYKVFNQYNLMSSTNAASTTLLTTSKGLLTAPEACKQKVGGELLLIIN